MKRTLLATIVLSFLTAAALRGSAAEAKMGQEEVIVRIKALGGTITTDEKSPDKPGVGVAFVGIVPDAELEHLKTLTSLQVLDLFNTTVTDAGLEHLKGLASRKVLAFFSTKVTDSGLEHLKGLTKLQELVLDGADVTDAGVSDLRKALPECHIKRRQ
jgi:hypothetical protein